MILYPSHLLNALIRSNSFLVVSLFFLIYIISNSKIFTSSFSIWMHFILFLLCLIVLAKTFSTMLNKHSESGHYYILPDTKGKAFNFSLLSIMLAVGLLYIFPNRLRFIFNTFNMLGFFFFNHWGISYFFQAPFLDILRGLKFLSFILLVWCITLVDFHMLGLPL